MLVMLPSFASEAIRPCSQTQMLLPAAPRPEVTAGEWSISVVDKIEEEEDI